jgi:hypothetical protein
MSSSSSSSSASKHCAGCQCDKCSLVESEQLVTISHPSLKALLRGSRAKGFAGLKPIKVKLWSSLGIYTSTASSALSINTNYAFNSSNFPELSSFINLYDEVRVLKVKLHYWMETVTIGVGYNVGAGALAIGFDPTAVTPTSVNNTCENSFTTGPLAFSPINANGSLFLQKFHTLVASAPKLAPITSSDCPGNAWTTLDGGTPFTSHVLLGYANSLSTAGQVAVSCYFELDVEFRLRV